MKLKYRWKIKQWNDNIFNIYFLIELKSIKQVVSRILSAHFCSFTILYNCTLMVHAFNLSPNLLL